MACIVSVSATSHLVSISKASFSLQQWHISRYGVFPSSVYSTTYPWNPAEFGLFNFCSFPTGLKINTNGFAPHGAWVAKKRPRLFHPCPSAYPCCQLKQDGVSKRAKEKGKAGGIIPKLPKAARRFYNDNFRGPPQRLSKVLAAAGVASRRRSEELIFGGKVTLNGSVCNLPQTRVDPAKDVIYVNGNRLPRKLSPKVYFALNKPKGYICSSGEKETKSVISLFDDYLKIWGKRNPGFPTPRLFTVGRLDVATTGLIIVTNDGEFAQSLSHPSSSLTKEYIATVDGAVTKRHLLTISEGTVVDGVFCTPDSVELLPHQSDLPRHRLRIVVHDGRNHEIRELVKNAGLEVHSLKRIRIGRYRLPADLGIGKHVELQPGDLKILRAGSVKEIIDAKPDRSRLDLENGKIC